MGRKHELDDMRGKDSRELEYELGESRKSLFTARLQMGESGKNVDMRGLRRRIARLITLLRERQLAETKNTVTAEGGAADGGSDS